jgi:hypothetical protein
MCQFRTLIVLVDPAAIASISTLTHTASLPDSRLSRRPDWFDTLDSYHLSCGVRHRKIPAGSLAGHMSRELVR